ncbi:MAG: radical SAM protein [Candidatus Methanomethylicia archaeon]
MSYDIIITSDRTMISNHHSNEFLGFLTTSPSMGLPEPIWMWLAAPKVKVDKIGRPIQAPYGLRKIEAALQNAGFKAAIIDPDHIYKHLDKAKIVMIGHHDYFALGPPSCEWMMITGREPVNARSFRRFMERFTQAARNKDIKIVVGGPAAWQWLYMPKLIEKYRISTIIDGEADKIITYIAQKILRGDSLPKYIQVSLNDTPRLDEIPLIKYPSVNGFIEVMRGCPRKCRFCSVTLRPLRIYTFNMIERELKVNSLAGIRKGILHAEDLLLYGSDGVKPKPEPLIKLHELVKKYYMNIAWSHVSLSTVKYGQENFKLISKLTEIIYGSGQSWIGVEVGVETGSVRLARRIMPMKALPYPPETWPEVVEDAFMIMHEHRIIPAATIIIGLPDETEDDVLETIELMDKLKKYRSLIVPMFFVPMGTLKDKNWFKILNIREAHEELLVKCFRHSIYWAEDILSKFYLREPHQAPLNILLKTVINYFKIKTRSFLKYYENRSLTTKLKICCTARVQ